MPKRKPGTIHRAKNGAYFKVLASGKCRFISAAAAGAAKKKGGSIRRKKKGGSASIGGSLRKKKGGSARVGGGFLKNAAGAVENAYNAYSSKHTSVANKVRDAFVGIKR